MKTGIALFVSGFSVGALALFALTPAQPRSPVGAAEVSDLITRLAPLTREPSASYWGVRIIFTGAGVKIEMHMANNDEYSASASTLAGAVDRLTAPSADIQSAVKGWKAP